VVFNLVNELVGVVGMNGRVVDMRGWEKEGGNDVQGEHWLHGCGILKVVGRRNLGCRCSSSGIVDVGLEEGTLMELEGQVLCCAVGFVDVVDGP